MTEQPQARVDTFVTSGPFSASCSVAMGAGLAASRGVGTGGAGSLRTCMGASATCRIARSLLGPTKSQSMSIA